MKIRNQYKLKNPKKESILCQQCQVQFISFVSKKQKFCSRKCFQESKVFTHTSLHTDETKEKISLKKKGISLIQNIGNKYWNNPKSKANWFKKGCKPKNWQGGQRTLSQKIHDDVRWPRWRLAVFKRDNFQCQDCGNKKTLEPHHIKSKVKFPELAFVVSNGITLCKKCHKLTPNYGGKKL